MLSNGRPVAVFDAKSKLEGATSGYPNADAYQMLAYCNGAEPNHRLVGNTPKATRFAKWRVSNTGIDLVYHPLDLEVPPAHLLHQNRRARSRLRLPLPTPCSDRGPYKHDEDEYSPHVHGARRTTG